MPSLAALQERLDLARTNNAAEQSGVWRQSGVPQEDTGWILWQRGEYSGDDPRDFRFKLYVSPTPEELLTQFTRIMDALSETEVCAVKLGNTVYGLLRPDKMVAYFRNRESLKVAAEQLSPSLDGIEAHAVPFTANLSENGVLSWGVDPVTSGEKPILQLQSWRGWITRQLARALVQARRDTESGDAPWKFALNQLGPLGIDPTTFAPAIPGWAGEEST